MFDNEFEYREDNLPYNMQHVTAIPDELFNNAQAALFAAIATNQLIAQEAKVAYAYKRKNEMSLDSFGGERNKSYSGSHDDVIIQVTVRVPNPKARDIDLDDLITLEEDIKAHKVTAEQKRLAAEIAEAEAEAEQAEAIARKKREELEALRKKQGPAQKTTKEIVKDAIETASDILAKAFPDFNVSLCKDGGWYSPFISISRAKAPEDSRFLSLEGAPPNEPLSREDLTLYRWRFSHHETNTYEDSDLGADATGEQLIDFLSKSLVKEKKRSSK